MYLPLYFQMDRLPCLLVGAGKIAVRKAEILLASGSDLNVVAPEIDEWFQPRVLQGTIRWRAREYQPGDCDGCRLVVAATPNVEVNRKISAEARQKGIPINVVDAPELCTVIFGAVWRDGPLTIAVSTGGAAPFMAAEVRNRIAQIAGGLGRWTEAAARFRSAVREAVNDPAARDRLYRRFVDRMRTASADDVPGEAQFTEWLAWLDAPREK